MPDLPPVRYLTIDDVLQLHVAVMEATGSYPQPLRSEGGLESAVKRAETFGYYQGADLVGQAARLGIGISRAQAFLEGNKRTAFAALDVFLRLNGLAFVGDPLELGRTLEALASPAISDDEADDRFEQWLRDRVGPRS